MMTPFCDVIGLIPAAGRATRLPLLKGSKEIIPVNLQTPHDNGTLRPKVACEYLLEHMDKAGITKVYLVLREGKWDIPAYFGDGSAIGINLAYLMMGLPYGPPFTLDQAYSFVQQSLVAIGFPDIIFESDDAFAKLITKQMETHADVVLGLFPADQPEHVDMVEVDNDSRVSQIVIKPSYTALTQTWGIAVWTPAFTHFMHQHLMSVHDTFASTRDNKQELHVGDVIQAAIKNGLRVTSVPVSDKPYIDIGIPENLARVRAKMADGIEQKEKRE